MKFLPLPSLLALGAMIAAALPVAQAGSGAATHFSNTISHSGAASAEAVTGTVKLASGAVAVPVWMAGKASQGAGLASTAAGQAFDQVGESSTRAAKEVWDFSRSEAGARPTANRGVGLPPRRTAQQTTRDPSPAEAMGVAR